MNTLWRDSQTLHGPKWELVQRILASKGFQKAARLREFLLYVATRALEEHADEITEQQIGVHVFGRPPDYHPGDDNVVRSQARLLRIKLEQYFATEGKNEPIVLEIPKGTYIPVFRPPALPAAPRRRAWLIPILAAGVLLLAAVCGWLVWGRLVNSRAPSASSGHAALWESLFARDRQTMIVVSDHTFGLLQEAARESIPLSEYLSPEYHQRARALSQRSGLEAAVPGFSALHLTGLYSVTDVALIAGMRQAAPGQSSVRFARYLTTRDFSAGNAILIGTRHTNPWVDLFDKELNFHFQWDFAVHDNYCVNRAPRPGEQREYRATAGGGTRTAYGGVAYLPTLTRRGNVAIIFGTSLAGSESSTDFITNEKLSAPFLDRLREANGGRLPYFEVLLRTTTVGGQAGGPEVVAYRVH